MKSGSALPSWASENETVVKIDPYSAMAEKYSQNTPIDQNANSVNENETNESPDIYGTIMALGSAKIESNTDSFQALNRWEGYVKSIDGEEFIGIVHDLDNPNAPQEEVTVDLADISQDDRELIQPGAVFYWNIGYRITEYRQEIRCSEFRFRRLPAWRKKDLAEAKETAASLRSRLFGL